MATAAVDIEGMILSALQQVHPTVGLDMRNQHPKTHGVVEGMFQVFDSVPDAYRMGVFQEPSRSFPVSIRFSNGKEVVDNKPDVRGMAIKLYDVPTPDGTTIEQDFITADCPIFFARNPEHLLQFLKMLGKHRAEKMEAEVRGASEEEIQSLLFHQIGEATAPHSFPALSTFFSVLSASPLELTYHSQLPYQLGELAVKYVVRPRDGNQLGQSLDGTVDQARHAMQRLLIDGQRGAEFEFCVIVQTNDQEMPIEDPTQPWNGEVIPLALITIPPQNFIEPEKVKAGENVSFNPWNGLTVHRPLGSLGHLRLQAYRQSALTRDPHAQRIREFYKCFAIGDYHGMQACLHDDVKFHDMGFDLQGKGPVGLMWQMICLMPDGIRVRLADVGLKNGKWTAHWECHYYFRREPDSAPRPVHNKIEATFQFKDGLIVGHEDTCDFWNWFKQATGNVGGMLEYADWLEDHMLSVVNIEEILKQRVRESAQAKLNYFLDALSGRVTPYGRRVGN